jgi:hypothetical protein
MVGSVFFLTRGQHLTMVDEWIASEMKEHKMRAAEMEREKKKQLGDHCRAHGNNLCGYGG